MGDERKSVASVDESYLARIRAELRSLARQRTVNGSPTTTEDVRYLRLTRRERDLLHRQRKIHALD
jgi:hypothetical protein